MSIPWRDTALRYGVASRALHWAMAALLAWQFAGMIVRLTVGRAPITAFWVGTHRPVGLLLLALLIVRVGWALANRRRRPAQHPGPVGRLAVLGHGALYALMLALPVLGALREYGSGRGVAPFGVTIIPATGTEIGWMVAPANLLHGPLAWTLLALIAGHVAMVFVHRYRWRDDVLQRMAGRPAEPEGAEAGARSTASSRA